MTPETSGQPDEEPSSTSLIAGATGAIGRALLPLLANAYDRVTVVGRRAPVDLPQNTEFHEADLVNGSLAEWLPQTRHAYCCLGTTRAQAGSLEEFEHQEKGMIFGFARMARDAGVSDFALVSSLGADAQSIFAYNRIKGQIEQELMAMEFEHLRIFRPSLLLTAPRPDNRPGEKIGQALAPLLNPLLCGPLKRYRAVEVAQVAAEMVTAMTQPQTDDQVTIHFPSESL